MADKPNVTIHITGANPQIYPTAEHITHNHFYGDKFAAEAIKANQKEIVFEEKEEVEEATPLRKFLPNREDHDYVLEWAPLCHSPKDIYNNIVMPLKRKGYDIVITTNIPFLTALIPYLSNYTSSKSAESISRALRK